MDFISACLECAKDDELINEFCRIKGLKQPERVSLMENRFAIVSGYPAECVAARQFADFIFGYVYARSGSLQILEPAAGRKAAAGIASGIAGDAHQRDRTRQLGTAGFPGAASLGRPHRAARTYSN